MKIASLTILLLTSSVMASPLDISLENEIGSITTVEVFPNENKAMSFDTGGVVGGATTTTTPGPTPTPEVKPAPTLNDRVEQTGKIISTAKDIVALGEAIYELVKKGKPSNTTEYAPISVVPKDPTTKEPVDPFSLEGFSMPVEKNFETKITNLSGKEVVKFNYKVFYSYGGSYNGSGKYLTGVIVVPTSVQTSFGWTFSASMKVTGLMNHGSSKEPVAGVMVTIKYQMNSWANAFERNDTIHVTGRGEFRSYGVK